MLTMFDQETAAKFHLLNSRLILSAVADPGFFKGGDFCKKGGGVTIHSKTSFEKNCFSAWASTLNMGLINKVDMVCLSPVGYGV